MKKLTILITLLFMPMIASAGIIGLVSYSEGEVFLQGNQKIEPGVTRTINNQETIRSQGNSKLVISFRDGSQLILFENSSIQLDFSPDSNTNLIRLEQGDLWLLIARSNQPYRIQLQDAAVVAQNAVLRFNLNTTNHSGYISITTGAVTILDSQSKREYAAGSRVLLQNGLISQVTVINTAIQLKSSLTEYYLPKSGQLPVLIRASMPSGYSIRQPVPAIVISSSPNLTVKSPVISFYQEEIEIEATALGTGVSDLYIVSDPVDGNPGVEGALPVSVSPMRDTKIMKIKTSRGNINLKLAPVEN